MYNIVELSSHFNFAHNTGRSIAGEYASLLLNEVSPMHQGGMSLINLTAKDCQCVGLAFTAIALEYDFGDKDANSVAAENAYYCLAKSFIEEKNTFTMPAIFSLLDIAPELLEDKFQAVSIATYAISLMAHIDCRMMRRDIAFYALTQFYDIQNQRYTVPTDMYIFLPAESSIKSFISKMKSNIDQNLMDKCRRNFEQLFKQCEETLLTY